MQWRTERERKKDAQNRTGLTGLVHVGSSGLRVVSRPREDNVSSGPGEIRRDGKRSRGEGEEEKEEEG